MNKKIYLSLLLVFLFIGVGAFILKGKNEESNQKGYQPKELKHSEVKKENAHDEVFNAKFEDELKRQDDEGLSEEFPEYEFNRLDVYKWANSYPKSREKLIEVATSKDPYKDQNIEVKPHSAHELKQEQYGALRVMALQALFDKEDSSEKKIENLNEVLKKAKDPIIKKIAKSMINSHKEGRDYMSDFLEAAGE